jgi:hypothetical protein
MKFAQAIQTPSATTTTNGMVALEHTGHALVDLFFSIGASRNDMLGLQQKFAVALAEDKGIATKMLFWARDVRAGAGERDVFRNLLIALEQHDVDAVVANIDNIPFYGRWDDGWCLQTPKAKDAWMQLIKDTLFNQTDGFKLCAKWQPRKGPNAVALRKFMGLSPKAYRKLLVNSTDVVETKMCSQDWNNINYSHVPSVAAKRYQKAFNNHDPAGYSKYRDALASFDGSAKINASAIFPHDVVVGIRRGDQAVGQAQWDALPNYLGDNYILPVVDTSGSMSGATAGNSSVTCMDVALSLGLYIANKQEGAFHKVFCTFSCKPELQVLKSVAIADQMKEMKSASWGMNTNLEATFDLILKKATENKVPPEEMPKYIVILSDMQFDSCVKEPSDSAMSMIHRTYSLAGYEVPNVVFWNLNNRHNAPTKFTEAGTALISGFSPSILKSVLSCESLRPDDVMFNTLNDERYNRVVI